MPKKQEPETIDRFRITGETTAEKVGVALGQLARLGVQVTGCELITDVLMFQKQQQHETGHDDFAMEWLKDHPTFKLRELRAHFLANGRISTNAYHACKRLVKAGVLIDLTGGHYRRADVKALPKPAKAKTTKVTKNTGAIDLVRDFLKRKKTVDTKQLRELFKENGRPEKFAHQTIYQLVAKGELKLQGEKGSGQYEVVKKTKEGMNGSSSHTEVAAHG